MLKPGRESVLDVAAEQAWRAVNDHCAGEAERLPAHEFLVAGRGGGTAAVRVVQSGFLDGGAEHADRQW